MNVVAVCHIVYRFKLFSVLLAFISHKLLSLKMSVQQQFCDRHTAFLTLIQITSM